MERLAENVESICQVGFEGGGGGAHPRIALQNAVGADEAKQRDMILILIDFRSSMGIWNTGFGTLMGRNTTYLNLQTKSRVVSFSLKLPLHCTNVLGYFLDWDAHK